jgi:hypothetical protein
MNDFWFQIDLAVPVAMTTAMQQSIVTSIQPRWRINSIEMTRLGEGLFRLKLMINSDTDLTLSPATDELREFRDLVVTLVAFSAMAPVQLRSKGVFDFPIADGKRKQTSLGPMNMECPPTPLSSLHPLILGLALPQKYQSAIHFLWEALNCDTPLYRFINLAIAVELLVRHDSTIRGSRHPNCGDTKCGHQLEKCPQCGRQWKIPAQLRERAAFLIPSDIVSDFISARNQVFHGLSDELHHDYSETIPALNSSLLVILRNYLGQQMGMPPITEQDLGIALNPPEVSMTVFYTEATAENVRNP